MYTLFFVYMHFLITLSGLFRRNMFVMLYIFRKIEVCSFQTDKILKFKRGRTRVIRKWTIWSLWKSYSPEIKHFFGNFFLNGWVILLSNKILSENIFNGLFGKIRPKMLIWGIYLLAIPGYNLSQSLIFYDRKIFRQILCSPTIEEYRD